jgi:protoporphyrinogen oxidase
MDIKPEGGLRDITSGRPGVTIIGAGPAGLTAAYLLSKAGVPVTVLESDPQDVGGISRTAKYKGFRFDIGGHRFFSKSKEVEDFWTEILGDGMMERPRLSRIFYRGQFYSYPLKAMEALSKLGILESALCLLSYIKARISPIPEPKSFEDWVTNQFGSRLYRIFFKTYTEKVWGMDCKDISADWAAQRIKGLSLATAIKSAILPKRASASKDKIIKSLIDSFRYPRLGPGMMWETCAEKTRDNGGRVLLGHYVDGCAYSESAGTWTVSAKTADGKSHSFESAHVISSAPMRELVSMTTPAFSMASAEAAGELKYREFLTVAIMLKDTKQIPDNWIYIHDPGVRVGRIQNFKSWSPHLVPDPSYACYGLEYFCFEGDGLWNMKDSDLLKLAGEEVEKVGLAKASEILDGCVVRQKKAYPVYDDTYSRNVETIRKEIADRYPGLHLVGRNGMHKYNNQDHAMMTAMLTVKNILSGSEAFDVWQVNQDAEYHESGESTRDSAASGLRMVPERVKAV